MVKSPRRLDSSVVAEFRPTSAFSIEEKERELTKKRHIWIVGLKALFAVNIIWQLVNIVAAIAKIENGFSVRDLYRDGLFLVMRISGDIATVCFLITGIFLRSLVKDLPRNTTYEQELAEKQ